MDVQIFDKLMKSALPPNSFGFNLKLAVFGMDAGTGDECEINGEGNVFCSNKLLYYLLKFFI